jgi:hypothetical protein
MNTRVKEKTYSLAAKVPKEVGSGASLNGSWVISYPALPSPPIFQNLYLTIATALRPTTNSNSDDFASFWHVRRWRATGDTGSHFRSGNIIKTNSAARSSI